MARPSLTEAERATLIRKVANGAKRSEVAKEFGCTRANVTRLCNARAVSCLTRDIAEQHEVEAIHHMLDNKDKSIATLLEVSRAILANFDEHGSRDLDNLTISGNQAKAAVTAIKPIVEAAKMRGWIVDKQGDALEAIAKVYLATAPSALLPPPKREPNE